MKTAKKIKKISKWLTELDIKHDLDKDEGVINFVMGYNGGLVLPYKIQMSDVHFSFLMGIAKLDEDTGEAELINPQVLSSDYKYEILQYMLYTNYIQKAGTWEYDHHDGDIRFGYTLILEDNDITKEQFERILQIMLFSGRKSAVDILKILETGKIPIDNKEEAALAMLAFFADQLDDEEI
jgi:hypothetical protein